MKYQSGLEVVDAFRWNGTKKGLAKICAMCGAKMIGGCVVKDNEFWELTPGQYVVMERDGSVSVVGLNDFLLIYTEL